jgi:methylated-DNA-[protein]-cysteine S-methyltransferase
MNQDKCALYYAMYDSPLGSLGLAATAIGLSSLSLRVGHDGYVSHLTETFQCPVLPDKGRLDKHRLFLDRYFAGKRIAFEGPFDLLQGTHFQRRVWATLLTIPYGDVRSYRWLAETVGHPGAYRAVGAANGQNPVAILIPCHRVINHNGALGGYTGGLDLKRRLLALECVSLEALTPARTPGTPGAQQMLKLR